MNLLLPSLYLRRSFRGRVTRRLEGKHRIPRLKFEFRRRKMHMPEDIEMSAGLGQSAQTEEPHSVGQGYKSSKFAHLAALSNPEKIFE